MSIFKKRFDFEIKNIIEQKNKNIIMISHNNHDNIIVIIMHNNIHFRLKIDLLSSGFPQMPPKIEIVKIGDSINNTIDNNKAIIEKKNKILSKIKFLSSIDVWNPATHIYCFLCEILEEIK